MFQNRPLALDSFLALPAVKRGDFMVGYALHTFRTSVQLS